MFKVGFKRVILIFCLLMGVNFCFTGCKEEEVRVSQVSFLENDAIVMVLGQTYEPNVSITPSYADNRDYYFTVGSNPDVIEIDGKKIIANKEGITQLKVVASDNQYLNDVISVKVLPEAIKLDSPTGLNFNGETFSFTPVENATSYILEINGYEFDLGNSNTFTLEQYQQLTKISPYDKLLTARVKAKGDSKITIESDYSKEILKNIKISNVSNLKLDNNTLMFNKVNGVEYYSVEFLNSEGSIKNLTINTNSFASDKIEIGLVGYMNLFAGGDYTCKVIATASNYETTDGVTVLDSNAQIISFKALASPNNLTISQYDLYWDIVLGADYYSLYNINGELVKDKITTNYFNLKTLPLTEGEQGYKVVAKVNDSFGIINGYNYSNEIKFKILAKPTVVIGDRALNWLAVTGVTGYQITIYNNEGEVVKSEIVTTNSYTLNDFGVGEYNFEVISCGNGKSSLNSLAGDVGEFEVLDVVKNLKIENKIISWENEQICDYQINILDENNNVILTSEQKEVQYDISGYSLDSGEYKAEVVALGSDNIFKSLSTSINFYKLKEISAVNIVGEELTFQVDVKTSATKVEYYNTNTPQNIQEMSKNSLSSYNVNSEKLQAGSYNYKVYALGNGKDILDADNTIIFTMDKLNAPIIEVDGSNFTINRTTDVGSATVYELYLNGNFTKTMSLTEYSYSIADLTAGEYAYSIKAIGNGGNVLDSNPSNTIKILKLDTPTISFDKTLLKFTVNTNQKDYVSGHIFKLNNDIIRVDENGVADCSNSSLYFTTAGEYIASVELLPQTSDDYDLLIKSNVASMTVAKINANSNLSLSNGVLSVSPNYIEELNDSYKLNFKIGYQESGETAFTYVDVKNIVLENDAFSIKVLDENYNAITVYKKDGTPVFATALRYNIKVQIENSDTNVISSDYFDLGEVLKLAMPSNLTRDENDFKFDAVSASKGYELILETNQKYSVKTSETQLDINELKQMFAEVGLVLEYGVNYNLQVVALGDDNSKLLSAKSKEIFNFKFLTNPTANFSVDDAYNKYIYIQNDVVGADYYSITFTDSEGSSYTGKVIKSAEGISVYDFAEMPKFSSGEIKIKILACSSEGNNFSSDGCELTAIVPENQIISVENGVFSWDLKDFAVSYILSYDTINTGTTLKAGVENYREQNGKAYYDFKLKNNGTFPIYFTAISKGFNDGTFYLNSNQTSFGNVKKLSSPIVNISSGEFVISLVYEELQYVDKVIIKSSVGEFNLAEIIGEDLASEMTLSPEIIMQYLTEDEIVSESFTITAYAKNYDGQTIVDYCLNSNATEFSALGVKPVTEVGVQSSVDYTNETDPEVIDKINWITSSLNVGVIRGYEITIKYNEKDYIYSVMDANASYFTFPTNADFGTGDYEIKIKTLAVNSNGYVNSKFSEPITLTICDKTKNLRTNDGVVIWDMVTGADEYLVKIFKDDELVAYEKTSTNRFEFKSLTNALDAGLYEVQVQAINEHNPLIISGAVSEKFEVLRLPEINQYKLDMGKVYVYAHSFVNKIRLTLTSNSGGQTYEFESVNKSNISDIEANSWSEVADLAKYLTNESDAESDFKKDWILFEMPFNSKTTITILDCISDGYTVKIEAVGNATSKLATVNSIVTNSASTSELSNINDTGTNLTKLKAPTTKLEKRGELSFELVDTIYDNLDYNGFNGTIIYEICISTQGVDHKFYMADVVDLNNLPNDVSVVTFDEDVPHTYYGYLIYNDLIINVSKYIDTDGIINGGLDIDFTQEYFYYIDKTGKKQSIAFVDGGNFDVSINIVGDSTKYLTSNNSVSKNIVRYPQLSLNVVDGNLIWKNLKSEIDTPVYLMNITNKITNINYLVYLYDKNSSYIINEYTPKVIEGRTYAQACDFSGEYIEFMFDTQDENGNYLFDEGSYTVSMTTYYANSTSNSVLQSKVSPTYQITKLDDVAVSINSGAFSWTLKTAYGLTSKYIYDYEFVVITDEGEIVFRIDESMYTVKNNIVTFVLPETVTCINKNLINSVEAEEGEDVAEEETELTYTFLQDMSYYFYVKALPDEELADFITSNNSNLISTKVSSGVYDVDMTDGVLTFASDYVDGTYEITLTYQMKDDSNSSKIETVTYITTTTNKYFVLPSEITDISGQGRVLTSKYNYNISIKRIGNNTDLSSFYSEPISVQKLATVDIRTVTTKLGELSWTSIKDTTGELIADTCYILKFTNIEHEDVIIEFVEGLTEQIYDFAEFDAGVISFTITTINNDYFPSDATNSVTVYKLGQISELTPIEQDGVINTLTWKSVNIQGNYADKYEIELIDKTTQVATCASFAPTDKTAETITFTIENVNIKDMLVRVRAVSEIEGSMLINGEWSEDFELSMAENINQEEFKINGLNFEWQQITNEQIGDKYVLQYTYKADKNQIGYSSVSMSVTDYYTTTITDENGEREVKVYYYTPRAIGYYENISVTVNRSGSLSSNSVFMQANGINATYTLNLFDSGDGTTNPYVISEFNQLINVNYFKDAHYILTADITMEDITSAICAGEFTGVFDGQGHLITNYTMTSNGNYIGLFETAKDATIKNLNISYATVNLTSIYADNTMYGAILVGKTDNCTISNVNITYSTLNVNVVDTLDEVSNTGRENFYFGGLVGYAINTIISNCDVALGYNEEIVSVCNITIQGWNRDKLYFGAIAGYSLDTNISGTDTDIMKTSLYYRTNLTISSGHTVYPYAFIGGIVGAMSTTSTSTSEASYIRYVEAESYQNSDFNGEVYYNGGACGYLYSGEISHVTVAGEIGANAYANNFNQIYIGKLVAKCEQDVLLLNNNDATNMILTYGNKVIINEIINN